MTNIDTWNKHLVGRRGNEVVIALPPFRPMEIDDALLLAAWIVSVADPIGKRFRTILEAVQGT